MSIHQKRTIAVFVAALAAMLGIFVAPAQAAMSTRPACTTLWTSDGKGKIWICKTWTKHAKEKGYYGEYWGTIYGKNVVLQAWWDGQQSGIIGTGKSKSKTFHRSYNHLNHIYFRACKRQKKCVNNWW